MAVAFDALSTANNGAGTTSLSWTHTPSGTPTAVGVSVHEYQNAVATVSATYNSVSMGQEVQIANGAAAGDPRITIFGLANPSAGAQTVVVTFSSSGFLYCEAVTVTASDTTTCFTGHGSATGTGTAVSLSCTSATDDLVLDAVTEASNLDTLTVGGTQTQRYNTTWASVYVVAGSTLTATGASTTMSWTIGASHKWAQAAASFKVAGAAAGVTYPQLERGIRGVNRGVALGGYH